MLWFNWKSVFTDAEDPCPQLVFDQSVKMPTARGWAWGRVIKSCSGRTQRNQGEEWGE